MPRLIFHLALVAMNDTSSHLFFLFLSPKNYSARQNQCVENHGWLQDLVAVPQNTEPCIIIRTAYHFKPQQMPNVTTQSIHIKNSSRFVSKDIGCCCGVSRALFTHWRSLVSHTSDTQTKGSSCLVDSWYIDANICFLHASCNDRLSLSLQALAPFCESA